jgi:hypothetical protein
MSWEGTAGQESFLPSVQLSNRDSIKKLQDRGMLPDFYQCRGTEQGHPSLCNDDALQGEHEVVDVYTNSFICHQVRLLFISHWQY